MQRLRQLALTFGQAKSINFPMIFYSQNNNSFKERLPVSSAISFFSLYHHLQVKDNSALNKGCMYVMQCKTAGISFHFPFFIQKNTILLTAVVREKKERQE